MHSGSQLLYLQDICANPSPGDYRTPSGIAKQVSITERCHHTSLPRTCTAQLYYASVLHISTPHLYYASVLHNCTTYLYYAPVPRISTAHLYSASLPFCAISRVFQGSVRLQHTVLWLSKPAPTSTCFALADELTRQVEAKRPSSAVAKIGTARRKASATREYSEAIYNLSSHFGMGGKTVFTFCKRKGLC